MLPTLMEAPAAHADEVIAVLGAQTCPSDAVLTLLEAVEFSHEDGGDRKDHDDFDGNGEDADERTQRAMDEVAEDEFVHACTV